MSKAYDIARERYAQFGIDTESVIGQMNEFHLSMHCWQADDVSGFESAGDLTGGIQATGMVQTVGSGIPRRLRHR